MNFSGIERLAKANYSLIITCDTGSTNIAEIEYANNLGIDIIVTDHHTLPSERPPLFAIINPRYFPPTHPLYNLSGVGVAYKLIEALYLTHPEIPKLPLKELLDLVAIGLIADLVQLTDDCRYLAQIGIEKLSTQLHKTTRPGVAKLLELCKKTGDRPTDISFGIGPRINAVSRIMGDASFCVELLTSRDPQNCQKLALETELANSRRKSLQKEVAEDVAKKLNKLDLSTTHVIVLTDPQWPVGVLGLVAGQIAQEYGRPTILLSEETEATRTSEEKLLARGSARSVGKIDLYELVKNQAHLLDRFGGHPFAAGLSLPVENIPIFTDAISQLLGQTLGVSLNQTSVIEVDLIVTVSELGRDLFQELKLLEPCGMGNPVPKLLIQNCWFTNVWHRNQKDLRGNKVKYIKTSFEICDESIDKGFPGIWWGHYKDEVPEGICDAVVELDFNTYEKRYEVRLIVVQLNLQDTQVIALNSVDWILDWRGGIQNSKFKIQKYFSTDKSHLSFPGNENLKFDTQNYSASEKSQVLASGNGNSKILTPNYSASEKSQVLASGNGDSKILTPNYSASEKSQVLPPENENSNHKSEVLPPKNENSKILTPNCSASDKSEVLPPRNVNSKFDTQNYSATEKSDLFPPENEKDLIILTECPTSWNDLRIWFRRAISQQKKLAIAYSQPPIVPPLEIWQKLLGIAKYLSRTGQPVTRYQLLKKLNIGDPALKLGLKSITYFGLNVKHKDRYFYIIQNQTKNQKLETSSQTVQKFLAAVSEEQFRQKYFCEVPLKTIEAIASQTILEDSNTSIPF